MKIKTIQLMGKTVRIGYEGSGLPLVFLHGYLESMDIWAEFIPDLVSDHQVIVLDIPGHGQSQLTEPVASMELIADTVKDVLDYLDMDRVFLTGHSLGGYATLAFLERWPERLTGIALFHSHTHSDGPEVLEKRKREIDVVSKGKKQLLVNQNIPGLFAPQNRKAFEREIKITQGIARNTHDSGIIGAIRGMMQRPDRSAVLKEAPVPCFQLIGRYDTHIDYKSVSLQTELPAGSERWILDYSGHMGFFEEKAKTLAGLRSFLARI